MKSFVLGAEIGGTKLQIGLGHETGELVQLERHSIAVEHGATGILDCLKTNLPTLIKYAESINGFVTGIGVGFGGPVDSNTGTVLTSHQVVGWDGFPLRQWFEETFHLPTRVMNDSNAAGWAEYCCGSGQGTRNFCYMNIGSGIGGALILDGKLYDGQGRGASEIGHLFVPDWSTKTPGASIKLELLCSGWSIEQRLRAGSTPPSETPLGRRCAGNKNNITCAMLAQAAQEGDALALQELGRVAESVGLALANVITLFHPERIAMGGGVSLMGPVLLDPVRQTVARMVFGPFRDRYEIVPCVLEEAVVVIGALLSAP